MDSHGWLHLARETGRVLMTLVRFGVGRSPPWCSTHRKHGRNILFTGHAMSTSTSTSPPFRKRSTVKSASTVSYQRYRSHIPLIALLSPSWGVDPMSSTHDLLVVGPGVLGGYLGKLWKEEHVDSNVVGVTNTDANHSWLKSLGVEPQTWSDAKHMGRKFPYVLFSAPPTHSKDFTADVHAAADLWDGSGSFLLTSSMSVCSVDDGGDVSDDACPVVSMGAAPNTDRLLAAEEAALQAGGNVVRLVGLYHSNRGPHTFFVKAKEIPRYGGYLINMLHYEAAVGISLSILKAEGQAPFRGIVFLGCDNHPLTLQEMVDHCNNSGLPEMQGEVKFTLTEPPASDKGKGKSCNNAATCAALGGWTPKFASFKAFMDAGASDMYSLPAKVVAVSHA